MAGELDRLSVVLEAETRPLREGFRRVEDRLEQFDRKYRRSFQENSRVTDNFARSLSRLGGVIASVGGATVMGAFVQRTLAASEALADTADKVGFSVERLQELRFAADQNGVGMNTLDMALQRFSRRVGEAANGTGELRQTLEDAGIELRNQDGSLRDISDILGDYANAIQQAESDQEALRMAFKAFDSEGAALVTLMRQGSEGIEQFAQRAREAGIVLEEGLVRRGAEANAVFRAMRQEFEAGLQRGVLQNVDAFNAIAAALGDMVEGFLNAIGAAHRLGVEIRKLINLDPAQSVRSQQYADAAARIRARGSDLTVGDLRGTLFNGGGILRDALGNEEAERFLRSIGGINGLNNQSAAEALAGFQTARGSGLDAVLDLLDGFSDAARNMEAINAQLDRVLTPTLAGSGAGAGMGAGSGSLTALDPLPAPIRVGARPGTAGGVGGLMPSDSDIDKITTIFAEQVGEKTPGKMAEGFTDQQQRIANGLEAGLRAAFEGNAIDFFANNLRNKAYEALADALTTAFSQGTGKGGFFSAAISALFGISRGGKRAAGGAFSANRAYLVGETGPEIMATGAAGTVINAAATRALAGQMSSRPAQPVIQQHFHLNAQGAVMTADLMREMERKANESATRMGRMVFEATQEQAAMNERGNTRTLGLP